MSEQNLNSSPNKSTNLESFTAGIPDPIRNFLKERGFESETELQQIFRPSLKDLRDPSKLKDLDRAVDRLAEAYEKNQSILIYGDFDLDGTGGVALLETGLQELGFKKVSWYQPDRLIEGYGLHASAVKKMHAENPIDVVLTVDVGITAIDAVKEITELGITAIITDHHLPLEELPAAFAVINPNRSDDDSGLNHLCGAGVGFYLYLGLRRKLAQLGYKTDFDSKKLLDVLTVATITDMVPVLNENRILVKHGLLQLANTERVGLRALLAELELLGQKLSTQDIGMKLAPKLNALSRMGHSILPIEIYRTKDIKRAQQLTSEVLLNNQERQQSQKSAEALAGELVLQLPKGDLEKAIVVVSHEFHRGVIGLVATKLVERYRVPAFVGSISEEMIHGSARLPAGSQANLLDYFKNASFLSQFGGHAMAAGFALKEADFQNFKDSLLNQDLFANGVAPQSEVGNLPAEISISADEISTHFMSWYDAMAPFGMGFTAPRFELSQVKLKPGSVRVIKGGHLRMMLQTPLPVTGVWFSPPESASEKLLDPTIQQQGVSLFGNLEWNSFGGCRSLQLLIDSMAT